jgi:hypothetical protein
MGYVRSSTVHLPATSDFSSPLSRENSALLRANEEFLTESLLLLLVGATFVVPSGR